MTKRDRLITKRTNIFDGQKITEKDLDVEQINNGALVSNLVVDFHGSGIVKKTPFNDKILLDTRNPSEDNDSKVEIETGSFDGKAIYLDFQPSDLKYGNRIEFELIDSGTAGRQYTKLLILGRIFNSLNSQGSLVLEFIDFPSNGKKVSQNYYVNVISIFFNNFSGGIGITEFGDTKESLNLISEKNGYLVVRESEPLSVYANSRINYQIESPNYDLNNFISSDTSLGILDAIESVLGSGNSISDLYVELSGKEKLLFEKNGATSIAYGQKFLAKANNLQKIDLLLSVERDEELPTDEQLDFAGDLVLSIHSLVSESICSTDAAPDDLIDFDPEPTPFIEISFGQDDLESLGYKLNEDPQIVSFNFGGTLIADPNIEPSLEANKYYAFFITRRGDNRKGTIVLEKGFDKVDKKATDGIELTIEEQFGKQNSKFVEYDPIANRYVNDSTSSLWHQIHSDTLEITDGTAYTEQGIAVSVPKTESFVGNSEISYFVKNLSLKNISEGTANYLIMSQVEKFSDPNVHPRTHNQVFTRIIDFPTFSIVSETDLENFDEIPLIMAKITDTNVRDAQTITGQFDKPGLIQSDYIYLLDPGSDLLAANLINRVITPDINCDCNSKYRIVNVDCLTLVSGDLNENLKLDLEDISLLLDIVGNTINSSTTEKLILGGDLDILDFVKADLNQDGTIDGVDIQLLENAIDGYVNFTVSEEIKVLKLNLENILSDNDYPQVFLDLVSTASTTAATNILSFSTTTLNDSLALRIGDSVIIPNSELDTGSYKIFSKEIDSSGLGVSLELKNTDGTTPDFIGSSGFNIEILSGTKVNIFADNKNLLNIPYQSFEYQIDFIEAPYEEKFLNICDISRDIGISFLALEDNSCLPQELDCQTQIECEPKYKNQIYLPGDLYLPNGNILTADGIPHPGDFEYTTITVPLPTGSIDGCSLSLYNNFVKSYGGTALTIAGFPAMKYSDGTLVGCQDVASDTDISKGRVKFDSKISSVFVDSLVDGYVDGYSEVGIGIEDIDSVENIAETYIGTKFTSFQAWDENALNDVAITNITHVSNQSAFFELITSNNAAEKFGRLDSPGFAQDFEDDFILNFSAMRNVWESDSLTNGTVSTFCSVSILNTDGSSAILKLGWRSVFGNDLKLFYSGVIKNNSSVVVSTFDFEENAPDDLEERVNFRIRRIDDVVSAYYIVPGKIGNTLPHGHYVRLGTNPELQPGSGPATASFEINQISSPNAGINFGVELIDFEFETEYQANDSLSTIIVGRNSATGRFRKSTVTFPFNLPRKTTIISAKMNLLSETTGVISDSYTITPLDLVNTKNLGEIFNVPESIDENLITTFIPGTLIDGENIEIDLTSVFSELLDSAAHLPGLLKGFVIEASNNANSNFSFNSVVNILVEYEDESTGIIFKIGVSIDGNTGIATFSTKNILYNTLDEASRTVISFGIYLKKAGFKNQDINLSLNDLNKLGIGTCFDRQLIQQDGKCYYVVGSANGGTVLEEVDCP